MQLGFIVPVETFAQAQALSTESAESSCTSVLAGQALSPAVAGAIGMPALVASRILDTNLWHISLPVFATGKKPFQPLTN